MRKKSELVLTKYSSLICNLPVRKRDLVTAQLLYPATEKTAEYKLARALSSLPVKKQMKLAVSMLTSKEGSFVKQSAEVMIWRRQINRLPQTLPIEKCAFWSGFIKVSFPLAAAALWTAKNILPSVALSAAMGGFSGGGGATPATPTPTSGAMPGPHMRTPFTPPGMPASRPPGF
jgi:hypothetical protein